MNLKCLKDLPRIFFSPCHRAHRDRCPHGSGGKASRLLLHAQTTACLDYCMPRLLHAQTTACLDYCMPRLLHAQTTACLDYLGILQRDLRVCMNRKIEQPICCANYDIVIFSSVKCVLQLFICCLILISTEKI